MWSLCLSVSLLIPKTSLELSANCLSVDAANRRRRAKAINENNETDLQKYAPKKRQQQQQQKAKVKQRDQFLFLLFDIWLFDISSFLVRAAVSLCRNDVMERQKELPKIKICLFKATTVASGGG